MSFTGPSVGPGGRTARRALEFGRTYVVRPKGRHQATIVWLHGLGDNGSSWSQLLETLPLPNIKWICPTAPTQPISIFGGFPSTAWFNVGELSEDAPDDIEGLDAVAAHVANLLAAEPADIKLGVGGFSMGAATSLYSATCFAHGKYGNGNTYPANLSAVVGLSGWLPCSKTLKSKIEGNNEAAGRAESLPILLCHGKGDDVVPYKSADEASLLELLSQNQMLKSLCLRDTNLADSALCSFSGSLLEVLDVSNTMISGAALHHVVCTNPGLKCLNARGCKNLFQPENTKKEAKISSSYSCEELFIELGKTCRLEEIALGWGLSYFSLQALKPAILSLRAMTVCLGGTLPEDSLRLLPTTCPLLESLVLYFQVISDCMIINILTSLRQLRTLALCYCFGDISNSSFNLSMPNLRILKLERVTPWMTNNDLVLLTRNCANLVELSLLGSKLNSDAQCIISHGWPGLISLHLEDCGEVTENGVSSLFNCIALENLLLRHNGSGIQRNFILEAASKMPMLRQVSLDVCDAKEGDFDLPDDADRYSLRIVKIARCKSTRCNVGSHFADTTRKPLHRETLVLVWNSTNVVRTVVKERL